MGVLIVGSACSGAGFMDLGFHRAGCRTAWFCEADPYRRRVLARHWPGVPIHHDLTELDPADLKPVDILIGGTPCPDWSVAGNRAGFAGDRASLYWHFVRIRDGIRPDWTVWENVPGVFSSHRGRDFALVLGALVGAPVHVPTGGWAGAGVAVGPLGSGAWRTLNAQWFGVPQRRRRVFVVADLGGVRSEQVLFEREGGGGHPAQGGEARPEFARSFGAGVAGTLGAHKSGGPDASTERGGASMTTTHAQGISSSQERSVPTADPAQITSMSSSRERERERETDGHSPAEDRHLTPPSTPTSLAFHATQDPISGEISPALGTNAYIAVMRDE